MADPIPWSPSFDFSDFEQTQPNAPKPGVQLDAQFDDISEAIINHRDAIRDIRRSDGALVNGIVTEDSLESGLLETLTAATRANEAIAAAAEAEADADRADAAADTLESVAATIAAYGYYLDDGLITDAATSAFDDGTIV